MASNIWDTFDKAVDTKALADEVKNSGSNNRTFEEVPTGTYEVKVEKLELVSSKNGKPMISCWMNILTGRYKGQKMFMNQVVEQAFQIHQANEFLRSLDTGFEVEFMSYKQYGNLLMDIHEKMDEMKLEYAVRFTKNSKGYNVYEVEEVFES